VLQEPDLPLASFLIVARNAAGCLPDLLADYAAQDYPAERRELIVVDGASEDGTRRLAERFRDEHPDLAVRVLDNPERILAAGWNVGLAAAQGDVLIRVDAHARIPPDFLRRNVERIAAGEAICGGQVVSVAPPGRWPQVLRLAETSRFGGGAAAFRNPGPPRYVDTLAYAAYRREVFAEIGGLDERLARNQDNELHDRARRAGYRFFYDPAIRSERRTRTTLRGLLGQKFGNGVWVGILLAVRPRCFRPRHLAPLAFVLALAVGGLLLPLSPLFLAAVLMPYLVLDLAFTARAVVAADRPTRAAALLLLVIFPLIHLAYGLGTLWGLLRAPFFRLATRGYQPPRPIR
jgi:glycosyltransferase involved in cell wall biosynthesis